MTAADVARPTVQDVTRAALAFIDARGLDLPRLDVYVNSPTSLGWDPQQARPASTRGAVPLPPGEAHVAFIRSGPAFVAWCRALGASRVCVDRGRPHTTRVWVNVWRDGIYWNVVGLLDHEYGAPRLAGADVDWAPRPERNRGVVSVDGLAAVYAVEVAP